MSARPRSDPPHRLRITVPASDTSVLRWLEVQESPSISLRMLVRAAIERDGYTDMLTRPVDQLPRRGRPAAETNTTRTNADSNGDFGAPPPSRSARDQGADAGAGEPRCGRRPTKKQKGRAASPDPQGRQEPQAPRQYSIDEIMSSTRQ